MTGTATAERPSSRSPWLTAYPSRRASAVHSAASPGGSRRPGERRAIRASSDSGASRSRTLDDAPGPQRQLVSDLDDVAQRPRRLLLRDAHPADVAQHVEVDRFRVPGAEVAHRRLGLRRQLPAPPGQVRPAPQAGTGHVAARGGPEQPALLQGVHQAQDRRLRQAGRLGDVADRYGRRVVGEQGQDVQRPPDAADPLRFLSHGAHGASLVRPVAPGRPHICVTFPAPPIAIPGRRTVRYTQSVERFNCTARWTNQMITEEIASAPALVAGEWLRDGPSTHRVGPYLRRVVSRAAAGQPGRRDPGGRLRAGRGAGGRPAGPGRPRRRP